MTRNCSPTFISRRRIEAWARPALAVRASAACVGLATVACALCGCGITQGKLLYFLAPWAGPKIEAEFDLTRKGPVLVLVDDFEERFKSPRNRTVLARQVGAELQTHEAVTEIIPQTKVDALRREHAGFEQMSSRELGEKVGAHQVLYLAVRDFYAESQVEEATGAARISVAVKVLNVFEKEDAGKVRVWPIERDGRLVSAELDATEVIRAKTPEAIADHLFEKLAAELARLFYDHRVADVESS
ncbi:MAG TPA: hypothetical protein VM243_13210 [Phycisphaerae bacterium]|nr:hypothetical protein [Phycisphaerae bacterium]